MLFLQHSHLTPATSHYRRYPSAAPLAPCYDFFRFVFAFLIFFFRFPSDPVPFSRQHSHVTPATSRYHRYPSAAPLAPWYDFFRFYFAFLMFFSCFPSAPVLFSLRCSHVTPATSRYPPVAHVFHKGTLFWTFCAFF